MLLHARRKRGALIFDGRAGGGGTGDNGTPYTNPASPLTNSQYQRCLSGVLGESGLISRRNAIKEGLAKLN